MRVLGKIPEGFPKFVVPKFKYMPGLIPQIFILGIIGYVLLTSVGKAFSQRV